MTDPAVEAARRAWDEYREGRFVHDLAEAYITAAREALAPIRELHQPYVIWEYDDVNGVWEYDENGERIVVETVCSECSTDSFIEDAGNCEWTPGDERAVAWPCETAKLIYREDEL